MKKIAMLVKFIVFIFYRINCLKLFAMYSPVRKAQNYKKILEELTKTCSHIESFSQVRKQKLSNLELVALNLTAEYMLYNTELQLFRVIKNTELDGKD